MSKNRKKTNIIHISIQPRKAFSSVNSRIRSVRFFFIDFLN